MILTCPDCATRYLTKPEAIGSNGRTVRCASCSATWFVPAEPDVLDLAATSGADPHLATETAKSYDSGLLPAAAGMATAGAFRDKVERKKVRRRLFGVSMMWGVVLAILSVMALALYLMRGPVVQKFPAAATLYQSLGIAVSENGLVFDRVVTRSAYIDGTPTVIIEGVVRNPDRIIHNTEAVKMSLHNGSGASLVSWLVELGEARIDPGAELEFVTQYPNPPIDATALRYKFEGATLSEAPNVDVTPTGLNGGDLAQGENIEAEDSEDAMLLAPVPAAPQEP